MKKYKLTDKTKVVNGHTLCRIQALKDFSDVKKGDLGGWVEKEENLSQYGKCWIHNEACVYDCACVHDDAKISDNAIIYDNARVYNNASVLGLARVYNNSRISGDAIVLGYASVSGHAWISCSAFISDNASISGYACVYGFSNITEKTVVSETPLQISGTKHFVNMNGEKLQIGYHLYSIEYWKAHFKKIGKAENYTDEQIKEYKSYIDLAEKLMDIKPHAV